MAGPIELARFVASGAVTLDLSLAVVGQLVLFAFFVLVSKPLLFDPLLRVFEAREERTAGAIERARRMDEQAIVLKQEYEERIERVRRQAAVDRERIRGELKKREAELMAAARANATAALTEGLSTIEREGAEIRRALDVERQALATEIASRVLGRAVDGRGELRS
jgi:F-type H+-transporting ATPase subunit b